jgi:hypothetical protein
MESWLFLVVGSFAAIGAALALGTLGAIILYHRTGQFPNQAERGGTVSRRQLAGLWARVVVGVVLALAGVVSLWSAGLILQ